MNDTQNSTSSTPQADDHKKVIDITEPLSNADSLRLLLRSYDALPADEKDEAKQAL